MPKIVGSIYSIQIFISTNLNSPTPNTVPEGCTETPTKFQTSPTSLHPHVVDVMIKLGNNLKKRKMR